MPMRSVLEKLKAALRHGLALEESQPSADDVRFIETVAKKASEHHLTFPLLAFVEGLRPAAGIASSVLIGLEPFAELFFPKEAYAKLISFVGKRENLGAIADALEKID